MKGNLQAAGPARFRIGVHDVNTVEALKVKVKPIAPNDEDLQALIEQPDDHRTNVGRPCEREGRLWATEPAAGPGRKNDGHASCRSIPHGPAMQAPPMTAPVVYWPSKGLAGGGMGMSSSFLEMNPAWNAPIKKSMTLLGNIIDGHPRAEAVPVCWSGPTRANTCVARILVRGTSKRWYKISVYDPLGLGRECAIVVCGARRRVDIVRAHGPHDPVSNLCLHTQAESLPVGDRVASLVLSLLDDRETAMRIPLVAQFIAADREQLKGIGLFSDHGPMPTEPWEDMHEPDFYLDPDDFDHQTDEEYEAEMEHHMAMQAAEDARLEAEQDRLEMAHHVPLFPDEEEPDEGDSSELDLLRNLFGHMAQDEEEEDSPAAHLETAALSLQEACALIMQALDEVRLSING